MMNSKSYKNRHFPIFLAILSMSYVSVKHLCARVTDDDVVLHFTGVGSLWSEEV